MTHDPMRPGQEPEQLRQAPTSLLLLMPMPAGTALKTTYGQSLRNGLALELGQPCALHPH